MFKFNSVITFNLGFNLLEKLLKFFMGKELAVLMIILSVISLNAFLLFYFNGLGLAYNDARSHLDIGRRVVEGLKPGFAQLGSVWLPLPHLLMVPTIWHDFFWHTGLAGAIVSMLSYVVSGVLIYRYLKQLNVGLLGRFVAVGLFALNINILYLQSTAMTELLLIVTSTASAYYLLLWAKSANIIDLIKAAFYVCLATLTRYDGWFQFVLSGAVIFWIIFWEAFNFKAQALFQFKKLNFLLKRNFSKAEGSVILFGALGGFGIVLWFLWNQLIFGDWLYFAFGPYSARSQQEQLEVAGVLITRHNLIISLKTYAYALFYNISTFAVLLSIIGYLMLWLDKKIIANIKVASTVLIAPFIFNILALYLGHSVLMVQGVSGDTWFNARYGIMLIPAVVIIIGYLIDKLKNLRFILIGMLLMTTFFSFTSLDAVTIDDARVGSSQKNVTEVSGWLAQNATDQEGFILISAASHDAIIFSSGLPMKRFIHEGTGRYWEEATTSPKKWARWIIMRTHDESDSTFRLVNKTFDLQYYDLVGQYPFADIYQLKSEYMSGLITEPVFANQK